MAMKYTDFIERVINDGIEAAKADYSGDDAMSVARREGSIEGFEKCRGLDLSELAKLHVDASVACMEMHMQGDVDELVFWRARSVEAEIEWVMNCVSAAIVNSGGVALAGHLPTVRGWKKAAEILGVGLIPPRV